MFAEGLSTPGRQPLAAAGEVGRKPRVRVRVGKASRRRARSRSQAAVCAYGSQRLAAAGEVGFKPPLRARLATLGRGRRGRSRGVASARSGRRKLSLVRWKRSLRSTGPIAQVAISPHSCAVRAHSCAVRACSGVRDGCLSSSGAVDRAVSLAGDLVCLRDVTGLLSWSPRYGSIANLSGTGGSFGLTRIAPRSVATSAGPCAL